MPFPKKPIQFILASPLFRQAGVYGISNLAAKAIPFLLLPVITRYLTPEEYGIVAMFMLVVALCLPFSELGLRAAATVKYYDDTVDLGSYVSTGLGVSLIAAIPMAAALYLFREPISRVTEVPADWIVLAMVVIATKTVWGVVMAIWRVKDRAVVFGVFQNAQSGVIVAGTLTLVVALERGWEGRIEAELIAWAISGVLAFLALRRIGLLRWVFVRDHARNLLRFGVPLIPHALGAVLIVQTDRTFITNFVSVEETGIFTVGYQLALIIELVAMSFNSAYSPWLYRKLKDADHAMKAKLVRYTYMHFVGIAVFALVVALIMPPLAGWLLDPSYERAGVYVHWFAVAFAFSGMYYMVSNYVLYAEKNAWLATATLTTAVINIPLNYVLIELNGAIGAAQATAIAMALSFVLTWYAAARVFPMPWSRSRVG